MSSNRQQEHPEIIQEYEKTLRSAIDEIEHLKEKINLIKQYYPVTDKAWEDGICKLCGAIVVEQTSNCLDDSSDYMNRCNNPQCKNHIWHFVGDDEFLDYYDHNKG